MNIINRKCDFADLLWEDILFAKVLPYLSIKDLFSVRGLSLRHKILIDTYFKKELKHFQLGTYTVDFSDDEFKIILKNCTQLREIVLPNCRWLKDDMLIPLFENNIHLSKVVLNNCPQLTSACLQPVIINCKELRCLSVESCHWLTPGCLQSITLHQHNLEEVNFSSCSRLTSVDTINNFLIVSHKLKIVDLSGINAVNDSTLTILSRSARQLENLNVMNCRNITDNGVRMVTDHCLNLKSISLVGCPRLMLKQTRKRMHIQLIPPAMRLDGNSYPMAMVIRFL